MFLILLFMGGVLAVHRNDLESWLVTVWTQWQSGVVLAPPKHVTAYNGVSIDSAIYKFGGGSGKFVAASNQYLSVPDSNDWYLGTGDFTIDFWVRFDSLPSSGRYATLWFQSSDADNYQGFWLHNDSGRYKWGYAVGSGEGNFFPGDFNSNPNLVTGTWYHIAIVRTGSDLYEFQSGILVGLNNSFTLPVRDFTGPLIIGADTPAPGGFGDVNLDGRFDEFRVSKGVARWTSIFIPPLSEYAPDSHTVLLLHMNNDFSDSPGPISATVITSKIASLYNCSYDQVSFPDNNAVQFGISSQHLNLPDLGRQANLTVSQ
jgi:hypothetical protein